MQELFIQIRKKLVHSQTAALDFVYQTLRKIEATRSELSQRIELFRTMEESVPISKEYLSQQASLFLRFYSRVSEKIFRKFLYYSMNSHSLDFTTKGLLDLYNLQTEMCTVPKNLRSFQSYSRVCEMVLQEDENLIRMLLQMVVDHNYVSSLDELFNLKMKKERGMGSFVIEEESNDEIESECTLNLPQTPKDADGKQDERSQSRILRAGRVFRNDFKRQLDNMLYKYQDTRVREHFLTTLSVEIRREAEKYQADKKDDAKQKSPTLKSNFASKRPNERGPSILRKASFSTYRSSLVKDFSNTSSPHGSQLLQSNGRIRSGRNQDFFVVTHNIQAPLVSYLRDGINTTPPQKHPPNLAKPVELSEKSSGEIELKPPVQRNSKLPIQKPSLKRVRKPSHPMTEQPSTGVVMLNKRKLRIGEDQTHQTKLKISRKFGSIERKQSDYSTLLKYFTQDNGDLSNGAVQTEAEMEQAINRLLINCGIVKKSSKIGNNMRDSSVLRDLNHKTQDKVLIVDMLTTNSSVKNLDLTEKDTSLPHMRPNKKRECFNVVSGRQSPAKTYLYRTEVCPGWHRRRQHFSMALLGQIDDSFPPKHVPQALNTPPRRRQLPCQSRHFRQIYNSTFRRIITPVLR